MPSGSFYTVNDGLQEILTRQKLEARQAMLDDLMRQKTEHDWKQTELENTRNRERDDLNRRQTEANILNQTENTRSSAEAREALNETRVLGQLSAGQDITNMGPEVGSVVDKYGKRVTKQTPSMGGETEGTNDVTSSYAGSPKEQLDLNRLERIKKALQDPTLDLEVKKALQYELSGATGSPPAGMFGRTETADKQNYDTAVEQGYTGSFVQFMREKANFNEDAPGNSRPFMSIDKNGNPILVGYNPRENTYTPSILKGSPDPNSPVQDPTKPVQNPGTISNSSSSSISSAESNAMRAALAAQARAAQGIAGTDKATADRAVFVTQNQIINKYLPEELRDGVKQILAMEEKQRMQFTRDQLVSKFSQVGPDGKPIRDAAGNRIPLPPDKQAILQAVLGHILGY